MRIVRAVERTRVRRPEPRKRGSSPEARDSFLNSSWTVTLDGRTVGAASSREEAEALARTTDVGGVVDGLRTPPSETLVVLSGGRAWVVTKLSVLADCRLASYRGLDGFRLWWIPNRGLPFPAWPEAFPTETLARCAGLRICGASPLRAATSEDLKRRSERASVLLGFVRGRSGVLRASDVPPPVRELLGDLSDEDLLFALETFPRLP